MHARTSCHPVSMCRVQRFRSPPSWHKLPCRNLCKNLLHHRPATEPHSQPVGLADAAAASTAAAEAGAADGAAPAGESYSSRAFWSRFSRPSATPDWASPIQVGRGNRIVSRCLRDAREDAVCKVPQLTYIHPHTYNHIHAYIYIHPHSFLSINSFMGARARLCGVRACVLARLAALDGARAWACAFARALVCAAYLPPAPLHSSLSGQTPRVRRKREQSDFKCGERGTAPGWGERVPPAPEQCDLNVGTAPGGAKPPVVRPSRTYTSPPHRRQVVGRQRIGCGLLVELHGQIGILTNQHVLPDATAASAAIAVFETATMGVIETSLHPTACYISSPASSLDYAFVACLQKPPGVQPVPLLPVDPAAQARPPAAGDTVLVVLHPDGGEKAVAIGPVIKVCAPSPTHPPRSAHPLRCKGPCTLSSRVTAAAPPRRHSTSLQRSVRHALALSPCTLPCPRSPPMHPTMASLSPHATCLGRQG